MPLLNFLKNLCRPPKASQQETGLKKVWVVHTLNQCLRLKPSVWFDTLPYGSCSRRNEGSPPPPPKAPQTHRYIHTRVHTLFVRIHTTAALIGYHTGYHKSKVLIHIIVAINKLLPPSILKVERKSLQIPQNCRFLM